jgi:diaminohydroxyphosphoribosylaminopyrimidine deaminase / 5-amino-6-(5-phosphoribosylamino)uracil reductase
MDDSFFMKMALDLAKQGIGYTSPNPMVGAVVVKDGKIVGKGWHQIPGGPHAEVYALDDAGPKSKGADLYVTLEPCNHHGKTPPCTEKIIASGIRRVVMSMTDPNPDVAGGGARRLEQAGIKVDSGVCEKEARRLIEFFTKYVTTKQPFVILKIAATLDGQIATRTGDSKWVTGETSRKYVHELRHAVDAILVGVNTVKSDDPQLTTRLEGKKGKNPKRIILDTHLTIPEDAKVLHNASPSDTIIITGNSVSLEKRKRIEKTGVQILEAKIKNHLIDLNDLLLRLGQMRITSLLIEGGSRVAAETLKAGIVDKICFFYAPKILGGNDGVPMFGGPGSDLMSGSVPITDISLQRFDDDILVEGYINKGFLIY